MKLLIKQRVLTCRDSYDIYDEFGEVKYFVKQDSAFIISKLRVYDRYKNEVGRIVPNKVFVTPSYDIEIGGLIQGTIEKKFTFFKPKFEVNMNDWRIEGDTFGWNYDIYQGCCSVIHISKELMHWGDTYVINIANPEDELMGLMLVIAIDKATYPK